MAMASAVAQSIPSPSMTALSLPSTWKRRSRSWMLKSTGNATDLAPTKRRRDASTPVSQHVVDVVAEDVIKKHTKPNVRTLMIYIYVLELLYVRVRVCACV